MKLNNPFKFNFNKTPRLCLTKGCKVMYKPTAPNQKYCPKCRWKKNKSLGVGV